MSDTQIQVPKPDHHFRAETPNIVFELGLSLPAAGLYTYLKKIAGDDGLCYKSQSVICQEIGVAPATYIKYRDELVQAFDLLQGKALITVHLRKKDNGSNDTTVITVVDIWRENGNYFRSKKKPCHSKSERPPIQNLNEGHSKSECKEEHSKKIPMKKDNVPTMPSCTEEKKKNFTRALSPEQKRLHDRIVAYPGIKSEDVCAWFLARKHTVQEVEQAFRVFLQDSEEGQKRANIVGNPGGYIFTALKEKRKPRDVSFEANKQLAKMSCKGVDGMRVLEKYVSYQYENDVITIEFNLPVGTFTSQLENAKRKMQQMEYA